MPSLFSSPPKPPAVTPPVPVQNTSQEAQIQAQGRRQGMNAAVLTGPGGLKTRSGVLTHSLTGE